jgi:uncharacterized protein (TIGR00266 family)
MWSVVGKGGAATAKVTMSRGQRIKAEPDALITMSENIELGAKMDAGVVSGLMRSALGGESLFSQTLSAVGDGDVLLGAPDIGDIELMRLRHGSPLLLAKGAFLAADDNVEISTATQRNVLGAFTSGAGLFVLRAAGHGTLAVSAHGSVLSFKLEPGETRAVDNGHLVAWSESMEYSMRFAGGSRGGSVVSSMFSSAASGEGLMCFFRGPGELWLSSHKLSEADGGGGGAKGGGGGGGGGGRRRQHGASPLASLCCLCLLFLTLGGAALGALVVVPAMGGHWARSQHDGSWIVKWDSQSPPAPRRTRQQHIGQGQRYQGAEYGHGRGGVMDEL